MSNLPPPKFTEAERSELIALTNSVEFNAQLSERAEALRWEQLCGDDEYELSIGLEFRSQLKALHATAKQLIDLRLERSPEADQLTRAYRNGEDIVCALLTELSTIINKHHRETFGAE